MNTVGTSTLLSSSEAPPADYDRPPTYHGMVREADVHVPMHYGVKFASTSTGRTRTKSHRICLEIASLDLPTGVAGATNAEYVPYHICSSKIVLHKVYHDTNRPSHLLRSVVPT